MFPTGGAGTAESLTSEQLRALDAEAEQQYESDELAYPWEEVVQASRKMEKMPLSVEELKELGRASTE